jgi:hypothetical protein
MKEKLFGVFCAVAAPLVWVLMVVTASCAQPPVVPPPPPPCTSWEYKVLYAQPVKPASREINKGGEMPTSITPSDVELNKEGKDGWELASTYLELETGFVVLGIGEPQNAVPNVRQQRLVMVFKRLSCPK